MVWLKIDYKKNSLTSLEGNETEIGIDGHFKCIYTH